MDAIVYDSVLEYLFWRFGEVKNLPVKVRQSRNDFFMPTFPPKNKRTNSTTMKPQVDLFSFVFWKKWKTTKRHFKIN